MSSCEFCLDPVKFLEPGALETCPTRTAPDSSSTELEGEGIGGPQRTLQSADVLAAPALVERVKVGTAVAVTTSGESAPIRIFRCTYLPVSRCQNLLMSSSMAVPSHAVVAEFWALYLEVL